MLVRSSAVTVAVVALLMGLYPARASATSATLSPILAGHAWLNGRATANDVRGKVVVVDVFTFECINCTRVTPNLRALWHSRPSDLTIVGVHTPEVPAYQSRSAYLETKIHRNAIAWPVVVDNDARIWDAYGVDAWPTQLVFDRHGRLRARIVGDSQDAELDATVRTLLAQR